MIGLHLHMSLPQSLGYPKSDARNIFRFHSGQVHIYMDIYGGFLSHRGSPSHHFNGMFPNKNHPAMGVPPWPWNSPARAPRRGARRVSLRGLQGTPSHDSSLEVAWTATKTGFFDGMRYP